MQVFEAAGHTCGRLSGLVGLTMSSVAGDRMSLMLSSLTSFSCASSSICGGVSPARCNAQCGPYLGVVGVAGAIAVDGRRVDGGRIRAGRRKVVGGV
jgi:hypothetical protein